MTCLNCIYSQPEHELLNGRWVATGCRRCYSEKSVANGGKFDQQCPTGGIECGEFKPITTKMQKNQTYGQALEALKSGKRVSREGWNGKGMFVFMRPADELSTGLIVETVKSLPQSVKGYLKSVNDYHEKVIFCAHLCMLAADGNIVNGWLASQTDMLVSDWCILD
jgi:hypothetical protein